MLPPGTTTAQPAVDRQVVGQRAVPYPLVFDDFPQLGLRLARQWTERMTVEIGDAIGQQEPLAKGAQWIAEVELQHVGKGHRTVGHSTLDKWTGDGEA